MPAVGYEAKGAGAREATHRAEEVLPSSSSARKQQPPCLDRAESAPVTKTVTGDYLRGSEGLKEDVFRKASAVKKSFNRPNYVVLIFGWSLAVCSGLVNVVAMLSFGTFVSHVTGSTSNVGLRIEGYGSGRNEAGPIFQALALIFSYLFGAYLCGLLIDKNQLLIGGKALYGVALVGNGLLLALSVLVTPESKMGAACLTAVACGLQNAMCTSHFGAVVRTTHVTGTITDIGSTLGRISMILLRKGCMRSRLNVLEQAEIGVDTKKLLVLGPMWLSFLSGGIIGAYLGSCMGVHALLVPAFLTFTTGSLYTLFRQNFKDFFKRLTKDHLSEDLIALEASMERTQSYFNDLKKESGGRSNTKGDATLTRVNTLGLEVQHILDTIHQVEEGLEDIESEPAFDPVVADAPRRAQAAA